MFGLLPEPALLLSMSGHVVAANRPFSELLGYAGDMQLAGVPISDLVADPADRLDRFFRLCRRSRQFLPGALAYKHAAGSSVPCRVEDALVSPPTSSSAGAILCRVFPKEAESTKFTVLNDRIETLHREILEHQRTQATLARKGNGCGPPREYRGCGDRYRRERQDLIHEFGGRIFDRMVTV